MTLTFRKPVEVKKQPTIKEEKKEPTTKTTNNQDSFLNGIGPYEFIKPLGSGKFSKVMLAYHLETHQKVAIKIIDKQAHDYRVMSRLVREIVLMESLQHHLIVRLYETFESCDSLFLVMEYVPGWNLDEYLQRQNKGFLEEGEARHLFRQLVAAVDFCHRKWIVHRDLKTPNILITMDNHAKLADFGLGNRYGLQRLRTICGSMLYYSPEIITGQKYYGPEVDCWCLGITLFRMTAGFEPFSHAHTVGELKQDVCKCNFPMPKTLSPELQATIRKCLQVDRRKRMTLRQALKDDPWLTNLGQLPCPLSTSPKTVFEEETALMSGNLPDDSKTRQQLMKDLVENEPLNSKVKKTIIYHPINSSTYYTATKTVGLSQQQQPPENIEILRSELLQSIRVRARRLGLRSTDRWKSLLTSFNSRRSIADLVQRKVYHFQLSTLSSTPSRPPSLSSSSTSYSSSLLEVETATTTLEVEPVPQEHRELMALLCQTCQLMGITYLQESPLSLRCVLTLRDAPKRLPISRSTSSHSRQQSSASLAAVNDSFTTKRLSLPLLSHLTSSMTTSFFGRSKPRHSVDEEQKQQPSVNKKKQGVAMFTIEIEYHKRRSDRISLRFSKLQGSSHTVFKMAAGWVAGVMTLDGKIGGNQQ
ncbi:MAG: kinase-like domain-containing protein [Benjaminiella poitrasii]|nr:MAG: kinase-like domain-containing protein [Benjaminiella poitrasii]